MRKLLIVILALAGLYSSYWMIGRSGMTAAIDRAQTQAATQGVEITWSDRTLVGFPSRFDLSLRDLLIEAPGVRLRTPELQSYMLSYRPNRVILSGAGPYQIETPAGLIELSTESLRASASVAARPSLPLDHVTIDSNAPALSAAPFKLTAAHLLAAIRAVDSGDSEPGALYDLYAEAKEIRPGATLRAQIDPENTMPEQLEAMSLDARLVLDRPLDRRLSKDTPPRPRAIDLRAATLSWGTTRVTVSGALTIDASGLANGRLRLNAQNWAKLYEMITKGAALPPEVASTYRGMLNSLAGGPDQPLEFDLTVAAGLVKLGPITLGALPAL